MVNLALSFKIDWREEPNHDDPEATRHLVLEGVQFVTQVCSTKKIKWVNLLHFKRSFIGI